MMNKPMEHTIRLFVVLLALLIGCDRRPLDYTPETGALVPIRIDWSQSKLNMNGMHRASVWLFPQNGARPIVKLLEGNLTSITLTLPVGTYSILVFNETIDSGDWRTISFIGADKYETFVVYARSDEAQMKRAVTKDENEQYALSPEALAVWSMDKFEVTKEMVEITRSRANSVNASTRTYSRTEEEKVDASLGELEVITPLAMTKIVTIKAYVHNLNAAQYVTSGFKGTPKGIYLATGKPLSDLVTYAQVMEQRTYDEPGKPKDGTAWTSLRVFGLGQQTDANYKLQLNFTLTNGTKTDSEIFDVTSQVTNKGEEEVNINVGKKNTEDPPEKPGEDRPIVLPDKETLPDIGVNGWENNEMDIW